VIEFLVATIQLGQPVKLVVVLSGGGEGRLAPAPIESDLARAAIDEVIE
jgi:hypothetical protein